MSPRAPACSLYSRFALLLVLVMGVSALAQRGDTIAIVPPFLDKRQRPEWVSAIRLLNQDVTIFLYQNAAAVYLRAEFVNITANALPAELSIPSLGYDVEDVDGKEWTSKGILAPLIWIDGQRVPVGTGQFGDDVWYSVGADFSPQIPVHANALFWVSTSSGGLSADTAIDLSPIIQGNRSLMVVISKAAMWSQTINAATSTLVLEDGLTISDSVLQIRPATTNMTDSTLQWIQEDVEPTGTTDITVTYSTVGQESTGLATLAALARFMTSQAYEEIRRFVEEKED